MAAVREISLTFATKNEIDQFNEKDIPGLLGHGGSGSYVAIMPGK